MWARVLREAGCRVRENFMLRDGGINGVGAGDKRSIEVVATGLSYERGVPIAADCTLVSPLSAKGIPHSGASHRPGITLERAAMEKRRRQYPELACSNDLRLVVAAVETGGRLHDSAAVD